MDKNDNVGLQLLHIEVIKEVINIKIHEEKITLKKKKHILILYV